MDYEPYDSSGTDDDFRPPGPQLHQNRMARGGRISGNGRPTAMDSMPYPRMYDDVDMKAKIHQLEQEAYSSVLRAFKAQADAITWDKESLITELRKELNLSNEEHRDLLSRVNGDETIQRIREWRLSVVPQPGMHGVSQAGHELGPIPSMSASRKKQKMTTSFPSQSCGGPTPFHPQTMAAAVQPSSSAARRGPMMGVKGKKHKSMHHPSGPAGRGQFSNRISSGGLAKGASFDPLIGRKVRTRWPADNNFYEAVITDYNPVEGRHALVYDMETGDETWEWVNISEIPPEDIQWEGEDPGVSSHRGGYGGPGHRINRPLGHDNNGGRGLPPSQNGIVKTGSDDIQLLHTDTLIKEVERVCSANHVDHVEIEKARKVLKEHEQALAEAIAILGGLSGGES